MKTLKLEIEGASPDQIRNYVEILDVLLAKGALDGVKAGSTTIHFDPQGRFAGVELAYWPYRKKYPMEN